MTKKALVPWQAPAFIPAGLTGATAASRFVGATTSGAPSSGAFLVGDFVIDQTGACWVCTTAGSPGLWAQVGVGGASQQSEIMVIMGVY